MCKKLLLLTSIVLALASVSIAEDIQWTGGGRNKFWSTAANWDLARPPTLDDEVRIDVPAAAAPNGPIIQEGIDAQAKGIFTEAAGEPTLTMTGGTLEVAEWIWWGDGMDSYAIWTMSGGTVTVANEFELGWGGGAGTLTMTGGTITAGEAIIPTGSGAFGELYLHGGTYNVTKPGGLEVNANGLIDITDGTLVLEGDETAKIDELAAAGLITALGGEGYLNADYDVRNAGKTTVTASLVPPVIEPMKPSDAGLVAYYAMEDNVDDSSANALHGTIAGDPVFVAGPAGYGMALDFDGVDDHVDCSNNALFSITDAFTLSVWINWRATGATWQTVIAKGDNAWRLARGGDTQTMDFGFTAGGDRGWQAARTASEVPLGEWHHVSATYDIIEGAKIYLDGVLEGTNPDTAGITVGDYPVFIGDNSQQTGRFWDGLIDEVAIYSRVLTPGEVVYLAGQRSTPAPPSAEGLVAYYALENDVLDGSGNGNDGTIMGDPTFVEGVVGMALEFDGDDYVDTANVDDLAVWTIACWAKSPDAPSGDPSSASGPVHREKNYQFNWNHQSDDFRASVTVSAGGWHAASLGTLEADTWYHLAGTYDGELLKAYADGVLITANDAPSGPPVAESESLKLARHAAAEQYFIGTVDEAMVYSRVLSGGEVSYLAGNRPAPVAPGTEGLVASYTFDVDASDATGNGYDGTLLGDAAVQDGVLVLDGDGDAVDVPAIGTDFSQLTYSMDVYPTEDLVPLQFSGGMNSNNWAAGAVHLKMNYGAVNVGINGLAGGDLVGTTIVESNQWSHIALTVSETAVTLYLNGEVEDSRALDAPLAGLVLGEAAIGAWNSGGTAIQREMAGQMDNVLVYSRGLSAGEVRFLAGYRPTPVDPGTGGLVASYALENDVLDGSGNELHGTIVGDPVFVEAQVGMGLLLDGVDDYVDLGNPSILDFGTGDFTVGAWINMTAIERGTVYAKGGDNSGGIRYTLAMGEANDNRMTLTTDDDSTKTQALGGTIVNDGAWHHVVGMRRGDTSLVYVDGLFDGSIDLPEGYDLSGTSQANALIGAITDARDATGATLEKFFAGTLDEVVVYRRALSDGEILYLAGYREDTGEGDPSLVIYYTFDEVGDIVPDKSGKGHDGVVVGDVSAAPEGILAGAGKFANGAYLDLDGPGFPAEDIPTSGMTLAAWINCENTGDHHAIFNARASDQTWLVHPEARSNGEFRWLLRSYGGTTMFDIRAGAVTWDEWLHFAGTYDKASAKATLYNNGELVAEMDVATPDDIAGDWGLGARVGKNIDDARPFTGLMDEFRLFTRALSQDEIVDMMAGM